MSTRRRVLFVDGVRVRWQPWLAGTVGVLDEHSWDDVLPDGKLRSEIDGNAIDEAVEGELALISSESAPMWDDFDIAKAFVASSPRRAIGAFILERCVMRTYVYSFKGR